MISIGSFLYGNMPIFLEINKHIFHIFVPIGIIPLQPVRNYPSCCLSC